jgi:hypothetical protein
MGMGGQHHVSAASPPDMTPYSLYRRLGGPQGRCGRVRKILPPPGFDPRTDQRVGCRYTDCTTPVTPPTHTYIYTHTHTHIQIQTRIDICVCVCVFTNKFLGNNLAVTEFLSLLSHVGFPQDVMNHFRGSFMEERLRNTAL